MTQFASTLYPQTNPTNPVLLDYRDYLDVAKNMSVNPMAPDDYVHVAEARYASWSRTWTRAHMQHAKKVLTRLAALTG